MNTEDKNKLYKWGGWALIALVIFLGVETVGALKAMGEPNGAYNSISVRGEGEVVAVPDVATFSFTVSGDAPTVSQAQTQANKKMEAILSALDEQGIEEKDIKTTNYSVYPRYRYTTTRSICTPTSCPPSQGSQVLDGYTANHSVTLKVRDTEKAGAILGLVGDQGATNISGISFIQDDPDKTLEEARELAIEDAKDKARELARDLGVRLVRIVSYYDSTDGAPVPLYNMVANGQRDLAVEQSAISIPQGENKARVVVTITYEIR